MEHLNRRLKIVLRNLGANVTPEAIQKAAKAITPVQHVCHIFEQQTATSMHSTFHSTPKDLKTVLNLLVDEKVFMPIKVRQHSTFKHKYTIMEKHSTAELKKKVEKPL